MEELQRGGRQEGSACSAPAVRYADRKQRRCRTRASRRPRPPPRPHPDSACARLVLRHSIPSLPEAQRVAKQPLVALHSVECEQGRSSTSAPWLRRPARIEPRPAWGSALGCSRTPAPSHPCPVACPNTMPRLFKVEHGRGGGREPFGDLVEDARHHGVQAVAVVGVAKVLAGAHHHVLVRLGEKGKGRGRQERGRQGGWVGGGWWASARPGERRACLQAC